MASNIDPENLRTFGFWGGILVLKLLAMVVLTARQRVRKQVFANEEDVALSPKAKISFNDPDVERVRRAHLNDIENVVPWFLATWLWLGTGPSPWLATLLIRGFVISRISYTMVYAVIPRPQPARSIAFGMGFLMTGYMATATVLHYY